MCDIITLCASRVLRYISLAPVTECTMHFFTSRHEKGAVKIISWCRMPILSKIHPDRMVNHFQSISELKGMLNEWTCHWNRHWMFLKIGFSFSNTLRMGKFRWRNSRNWKQCLIKKKCERKHLSQRLLFFYFYKILIKWTQNMKCNKILSWIIQENISYGYLNTEKRTN